MNRRSFLKISGSLAVGGLVLSVVGRGVWNLFKHPDRLFYDSKRDKGITLLREDGDFVSPYRRTFGFVVPDDITAMEVENGSIFIATTNNIYVYGLSGELQTNFSTPSDLRDIAVMDGHVYALFPTRVEVYDRQGEVVQQWDACSESSDYCGLAVCRDGVFVTDAGDKNITKYNLDGTLACFIRSPKGFIVPSYCFGITYMDGRIYCSNPGRHLVEVYTVEGEYVTAFGKAGADAGAFSGCCNPAIITPSSNGELLTSEKGIPRISCYSPEGEFRSILLDSKALGGGHTAYDVRVMKDKLIVAGGDKVSVFQYDRRQSQQTACGRCNKECPLKI
jgi:hypothetical protein